MDEDTFNMQVRKFLKQVGVTSQREIDSTVREAIRSGKLEGNETLSVCMTLTVEAADLKTVVNGTIALE